MGLAVLLLGLSGLLTGCAGGPETVLVEVTRFHALSGSGSASRLLPETPRFRIIPGSPLEGDSLEFRAYAHLLAQELRALGWRRQRGKDGASPARTAQGTLKGPNLLVTLSYAIDKGRQEFYTTPGHVIRYGGYVVYDGIAIAPRYHYVAPRLRHFVRFTREAQVVIRAASVHHRGSATTGSPSPLLNRETQAPGATDATPPATTAPLFEARAISHGNGSLLAPVMPALLAAIFQNFPGTSGESYRMSLPASPIPAAVIPRTEAQQKPARGPKTEGDNHDTKK